MCGIVGSIGKDNTLEVLLNGLKLLEYRGYDSCGIAYLNNNKVDVIKSVGRVCTLDEKVDKSIISKLGIAHTRWATNGVVNLENAHPHKVGVITLVHNGIIENAGSLKEQFSYDYKSDTDTEVLASILNTFYQETHNMLESINKMMNIVEGSYALAIINELEPDKLYAVKNKSPLIIGLGDNYNLIGSDISPILPYTKKYMVLEDKEYAVLTSNKVDVYKDKELVNKNVLESSININSSNTEKYEHFMLKEIMEIPRVFKNTINSFNLEVDLSKYDSIEVIGCGSAYHIGVLASYLFNSHGFKTYAYAASEYRYMNNLHVGNPLVIFISQSGETADTIAALEKCNNEGLDTLSIVNVESSTIARMSKYVIYTKAEQEVAVATTKAFICQLGVILMILYKYINKDLNEINNLDKVLEGILDNREEMLSIARSIYSSHDIYFIGRNIDYAICLEGSLKLKEVSYIHSEAYASGELKHGPIALIEEGTPVISVITNKVICNKTLSNVEECLARGANSIIFTNLDVDTNNSKVIRVPNVSNELETIIITVYLELLAYYVALLNKCDIDKPRNLAKSVTVE